MTDPQLDTWRYVELIVVAAGCLSLIAYAVSIAID